MTNRWSIGVSLLSAFLIISLLSGPILSSGNLAFAATTKVRLTETDFKLSVQPMAPLIPADGGDQYFVTVQLQDKQGIPIVAPYDLDITISASDLTIVSPVGKATISQGTSYVMVPITSTNSAGTAMITAQAPGVASGTASIKTVNIHSLLPAKIDAYAAPSNLNPHPQQPGKLYIRLLNSQNLPSKPTSTITVLLTSSDATILSVPSSVTIGPGSGDALVDVAPGFVSGSVVVTASSPGLISGQTSFTINGPQAEKLVLEVGPSKIPSFYLGQATGTVQLRDQADNPIRTLQPVTVSLASGNPGIARMPNSVVIAAGQSYTSFSVQTQGQVGTTTLTASASGYDSSTHLFTTIDASNSPAAKLLVTAVPSVLPPDASEHQSIVVQPADSNGLPVAPSDAYMATLGPTLFVTSSNPQYAAVSTSPVQVMEGYLLASVTTTHKIGKTTITASKEGFIPGTFDLNTKGPAPKGLKILQVPTPIQANGNEYNSIVVSLDDGRGGAVTANEDLNVYLTSANTDVALVEGIVKIPAGSSAGWAHITTTLQAGQSLITASSPGLNSATLTLKTYSNKALYDVAVYSVPNSLPSDGVAHKSIVVQLQDPSGNPVIAGDDIPITLSTSTLNIGSVDSSVLIQKGTTFALGSFTPFDQSSFVNATLKNLNFSTPPKASNKIAVTGSAAGYNSATASFTVTSPLMVVSQSKQSQTSFASSDIILDVFYGNIPISGATVYVTGQNAELSTALTDENGHAVAKYVPSMPGANSIIVAVAKPGFMPYTKTTTVSLAQKINLIVKAASIGGHPFDAKIVITSPGSKSNLTVTTQAKKPYQVTNGKFGTYTISAPLTVSNANGQYQFVNWSDGVTTNIRTDNWIENSQITAQYSAKYLLQPVSQHGVITGGGWYTEGAKTILSIDTTSSPGIITDQSFGGWTGDIVASSPTVTVTMDSPKTVTAVWNENYLKLFLIIAAGAGAGGALVYFKRIKPKRQASKESKENPPDLDWFKGT